MCARQRAGRGGSVGSQGEEEVSSYRGADVRLAHR